MNVRSATLDPYKFQDVQAEHQPPPPGPQLLFS
jgi:hypothetical protein